MNPEFQDIQEQNNSGLERNLVPEANENFEGEQNQFQQNFNNMGQIENPQTIQSDHSLHLDKKFDNIFKTSKFEENEQKINQKIDQLLGQQTPKLVGWLFLINKILLLTTFTEFIFQRFDVVTLFICLVIIFIELEIFTQNHFYKWLAVLASSLVLDALVLLDIAPVRKYFNFN